MNSERRKLLKLLSIVSIAPISAPLFAAIEHKKSTPTIDMLNLALCTWQQNENICPTEYVAGLNINKSNLNEIQVSEFITGNTMELDGLVLSKSEVASLASISIILKGNN